MVPRSQQSFWPGATVVPPPTPGLTLIHPHTVSVQGIQTAGPGSLSRPTPHLTAAAKPEWEKDPSPPDTCVPHGHIQGPQESWSRGGAVHLSLGSSKIGGNQPWTPKEACPLLSLGKREGRDPRTLSPAQPSLPALTKSQGPLEGCSKDRNSHDFPGRKPSSLLILEYLEPAGPHKRGPPLGGEAEARGSAGGGWRLRGRGASPWGSGSGWGPEEGVVRRREGTRIPRGIKGTVKGPLPLKSPLINR